MDDLFWILLMLSLTLIFATAHARRIGNERRDVVALGSLGGLLGAAAATVAMV